MLKIFKPKPQKVFVDRSVLEEMLDAAVVFIEVYGNGECWDEVLGRIDTDQAFRLSQALRSLADSIDVDLGGAKDFDY